MTFSLSVQKNNITTIDKQDHPLTYRGLEPKLPSKFFKDRLVAMVRDPYWVFCYWDFSHETNKQVERNLHEPFFIRAKVDEHIYTQVPISPLARSWYINTNKPGSSFSFDLGFEKDSKFISLISSNIVTIPPGAVSTLTDELWLSIDELYGPEQYLRLGASPLAWQKEGQLRAEYIASPLHQGKFENKEHFLFVDTEMIVYGKTTPDSIVLQNGVPLITDSEGCFESKIKLNEGEQVIHFESYAKNGLVSKQTVRVERSLYK